MVRLTGRQLSLMSLVVAVMLVGAVAHAQCGPDACVGPCNYQEILNDTSFIYDCPDWVLGGYANRVYAGPGNGYYISMTAGSTLYQNVTVPTGYTFAHDVGITINVVNNGSPGTEHLSLRVIRQSDGAILETIASFYPSSSSGTFSYAIGNYGGQNVRIEAVVNSGRLTGDTEFQVAGLHWSETQ
jgi:hypothetical protein